MDRKYYKIFVIIFRSKAVFDGRDEVEFLYYNNLLFTQMQDQENVDCKNKHFTNPLNHQEDMN